MRRSLIEKLEGGEKPKAPRGPGAPKSPRPRTPNTIQKTNHRHDALIDMMLARPDATLAEMARYLGFTKQWVYRIVNSDAFKARLEERRAQVDSATLLPLREKLLGIAHQTVDNLAEKVDDLDAKASREVFESVYDRLYGKPSNGGSSNGGGVTINQNFGSVDRSVLERGRARLHQSFQGGGAPQPEESSSNVIENEQQGQGAVGEVQPTSAEVPQTSEEEGEES